MSNKAPTCLPHSPIVDFLEGYFGNFKAHFESSNRPTTSEYFLQLVNKLAEETGKADAKVPPVHPLDIREYTNANTRSRVLGVWSRAYLLQIDPAFARLTREDEHGGRYFAIEHLLKDIRADHARSVTEDDVQNFTTPCKSDESLREFIARKKSVCHVQALTDVRR